MEFALASRRYFELIRRGRFVLVISGVVEDELRPAPPHVREFFHGWLEVAERIPFLEQATELREVYLRAGILTPRSASDALHVALAACHGCDVLVSWNCRDIVHPRRMQQYNHVNHRYGVPPIVIRTPAEVIREEEGL